MFFVGGDTDDSCKNESTCTCRPFYRTDTLLKLDTQVSYTCIYELLQADLSKKLKLKNVCNVPNGPNAFLRLKLIPLI